jgi:predicted Zn-dependent protease
LIGTDALAGAVRAGLDFVRARPGVRDAEVFAASNAVLLCRLNYTSHIPSNGVEEPKSRESHGLGLRVVFDGPGGRLVGFGHEPTDLGLSGVERALARARAGAVADPDFVSLPRPTRETRALADYHDPHLMALDDPGLVGAGWSVVQGGLRTFLGSSTLADLAADDAALRALGLILGGDVSVLLERVAIASGPMPEVQTDESTLVSAFVTGMVEAHDAKGSGWSTATRLADLTDEAGAEAARNAVRAIGGERVRSGEYTVIFGQQPVTDLLNNLIVPSCTAGAFYASSTPFLGKLGRPVASPRLTIYDHGAAPRLMGSKGITCEGLPTGRTDLIREGVLVGCLSNWYETQRLLRDPDLAAKLGANGDAAARALAPRNGFRFDEGGGRQFDREPGVSASNVVVECSPHGGGPVPLDALIRTVRDGLYVGRIWYTYPINGLRAGDFTCTVVGDSFIIRDGRLAAPLRPNTVRINDNLLRVLGAVIGVTGDAKGTIVWAADEVAYAPEIAVAGVRVDEIAGYMEELP